MATATLGALGLSADEPLHRIALDVYHDMGKLGLLTPADRVVLLDGLLVKKMSKGPRRTTAAGRTWRLLQATVPAGWHVRKEEPITLPGGPEGWDSEPEPDLAVVRGEDRAYEFRHPGPVDVALLVEVAETTLARDRAALRRYAWARIPCVWIVNLVAETVEVYTGPSGPTADPGYAQRTDHGPADVLHVSIDGTDHGPIAVADLLPGRG